MPHRNDINHWFADPDPLAAGPEIIAAVQNALADGSWGSYSAPQLERLQRNLQSTFGTQSSWLCSSGTIAVELALRGVGVTDQDEVILAGYDFPGNFRAIEAVGALPVVVDVCPRSHLIDFQQVVQAITEKTRAIIVSHLHGQLADIDDLKRRIDDPRIAIVEDACQCPGAELGGRRAGSLGDAGVLSFGGSKLLTAGRGGALLSNDPGLLQRVRIYAERGNDAFPMSVLQATVLIPQLALLDQQNAQRLAAAGRIVTAFGQIGLSTPFEFSPPRTPAIYKLPFFATDPAQREQLVVAARDLGVGLGEGFRGFTLRSPRRCRKLGSLVHSAFAARQTLLLDHRILMAPSGVLDELIRRVQTCVTRNNTSG